MGWLGNAARALLGVSAYQVAPPQGVTLDDSSVVAIREALGGQLQPIPTTRLRWYLAELERAQYNADAGNLAEAAQLYAAMQRDGVFSGLMSTRTSGLVRLDKRFYGDGQLCDELRAGNGTRSVFDDMCPANELAALAADGVALGVGLAELVPVPGRSFPVLERKDPEFLVYRWTENRWYFQSVAGLLPVTPGDSRWVLHIGGNCTRISPWKKAIWPAAGQAFINKQHALNGRSNWSAKLANPARIAKTPHGPNEAQRVGFVRALIAFGLNNVIELPPGWDVSLLESNGRGYEVYASEIATADHEYEIAVAGQTVTSEGTIGFNNAAIHQAIRADLIQSDGDALAYTVNTQILPAFTVSRKGPGAINSGPTIEWMTATPKDLKAEADATKSLADAIVALDEATKNTKIQPNIDEMVARFGVPMIKRAVATMLTPAPQEAA